MEILSGQMRLYHLIGAIFLLVANLLDIALTLYALKNGAIELNPFAKFLIETNLIIPIKIIVPLGILFGVFVRRENAMTLKHICAVWFVSGVYALVLGLNIHTVLIMN